MQKEMKQIPKEYLDRSKTIEALTFISEQDIDISMKVFLLIGYSKSINKHFSTDQIEFALKNHTDENVGTE